jgi:2-methylcitrate dehydratase PrpD
MTQMQTLTKPSATFHAVNRFTRDLTLATIPPAAANAAKLLILDLIGVLIAARKLDATTIACNHAVNHWAAGPNGPRAKLLVDGRETSLPGHAFAMATQIDNLDAHDGWQASKGHAGAALFPALSALAQAQNAVSGPEAIVNMVLGYEIAYRAAAALHGTVPDYHTSGAWNALGCAAIAARLRNLSDDHFRAALGIAEYHGPRSQMMREIANPSMLHDGTGWGAPTGVYAALIAEDGFTASPAATIEFDDAASYWADLGERWLTAEQYVKFYPICRWAHAPIDAVKALRAKHNLTPDQIAAVEIATFKYSADLNCAVPTTSQQAQYSLAWPVAAMLARGRVGIDEILESAFSDPTICALTAKTTAVVDPDIEKTFPFERRANVTITLTDGTKLISGLTTASGGPIPQPTEIEVTAKFRAFAGTVLPQDRVNAIIAACLSLDQPDSDFKALLALLIPPA